MNEDARTAKTVSIATGCGGYPTAPPYSPARGYPEYPFAGEHVADTPNDAYDGVRRCLHQLGLDADHFDTPRWNPLGGIVQPGQTVVLKPNFVRDFRESNPDHGDCLITHGAVLRAMTDYVLTAIDGRGRIIIADAPQSDGDFEAIRRIAALDALQAFYKRAAGFELEVCDLRPERAEKIDGVIVGHVPLPGDPAGYTTVDLGGDSAFMPVRELCHLLYGSEYDTDELYRHQHDHVHEYLISRTVLEADGVISIPKLKTHKKVGLTVNLKNLVGINGNKNWLAHHREGTPAQGGDQFPDDRLKNRVERSTVAVFKRLFPLLGPLRPMVARPIKATGKRLFGDTNIDTVRSGNWYGNDTTWRMVLDLNRILHYADADGVLHEKPVRRFLSVVDGIVAGEGNGPLDPTPRPAGVIIAGGNPVAVDMVCARWIGFDYRKMPMLHQALAPHRYPIVGFTADDIVVCCDDVQPGCSLADLRVPDRGFEPHFGWKGHIALTDPLQPQEAPPTCVG